MAVIDNKKGTTVWIHLTANADLQISGNDSVSNVAATGETVTGVSIRQVIWGTSGNTGQYWRVARGSNTVGVFCGSGNTNYYASGISLNQDPAANVTITLNGGDNGYLMLELKKQPESLQTAYDNP